MPRIRTESDLLPYKHHRWRIMEASGMTPDPWQKEYISSTSRRTILRCPRQSGKSASTAARQVGKMMFDGPWFALLFAPTQRQSKEIFDALRQMIAPFSAVFPFTEETQTSFRLANGSRAIALPATESTVRGFAKVNAFVLDEAAMAPRKLYRAIRPMLAMSLGEISLLSTPKGRSGFFWETWEKAEKGERWTPFTVTYRDVTRYDPDFLEEEREEHGERWFRQEYGVEFLDDLEAVDRRNPLVVPAAAVAGLFT